MLHSKELNDFVVEGICLLLVPARTADAPLRKANDPEWEKIAAARG
jgi:hypothetical protein